jgi:citrate lyase synthetase
VAVTLASEILLTTVCGSIAGVVVTTVVLDIGIQGWDTAMQTIQSLTNEARSQVTAIFIFMLFMGGSAAGSSLY